MKNKKLLPAIVALLVTAMVAISVTSVITPSTVSASATLAPTTVRKNTRVQLTVTVTNESATDNIDNVRVTAPSGSSFTQGIGGVHAAENLKLAADNMENAEAYLKQAGENLKLAEDNKKNAAQRLINAASELDIASYQALLEGWENVPSQLDDVASYLDWAGDNMAATSENFTTIINMIENARYYLNLAGGMDAPEDENLRHYNILAGENIDNAAAWLDNAGDALLAGSLRNAGENIRVAGVYLENAGTHLGDNDNALGEAIIAAGDALQEAGDNLKGAATYENYAGVNLVTAAAYLENAGKYLALADSTDLQKAADNLENAAAQIDLAGDNLSAISENLFQAADNLENAATYLAAAATELGAALGGDELTKAVDNENAAADNMKKETVNLENAGIQLIKAAEDLTAAATVLNNTATAMGPSTWTMSEGTNYVQFDAIGDNIITPSGGTQTFVFLWKTPNISVDNDYSIKISSNKETGGSANWVKEDNLPLTVDGKVPTLTIHVTQVGTVDKDGASPVTNLAGIVLDNGLATITITASETLKTLGTVYVENSGNDENFIPPVTMTTTDNIVYTGTFTVENENWDDNSVAVRVASAKDAVGNENTAGMENTVTIDTRAPIITDNGLSTLIAAMLRTNVTKAGTTTVYSYVDNTADQEINVTAVDNIASTDNGAYVVSVTVYFGGSSTSATRSDVVDNLWTVDPLTLNEGLNAAIWVAATDRAGNKVENIQENIENIYIDSLQPTIEFNTVAGKTWDENGELVYDNKPRIKITVLDPGYAACTGLGVARDNLKVYLDNDDNHRNTLPSWGAALENIDNWNITLGVFENILDNFAKPCNGLPDNTYWIVVVANDNLSHGIAYLTDNDNVIAARSFILDTAKPAFTYANIIGGTATGITKTQKEDNLPISGSGMSAEVGGTITIYERGSFVVLTTTTVDAYGFFSVTVTDLADGLHELWLSLTDLAGNESDKVLYGYITVDTVAPVLTVSEIPDSTDQATVLVSGTCDDLDATVTIDATGMDEQTLTLGTGGTFSYAVPLSADVNSITITATDTAGNVTTVELAIERTTTSWGTYAVILVIVALILAAIAIFKKR